MLHTPGMCYACIARNMRLSGDPSGFRETRYIGMVMFIPFIIKHQMKRSHTHIHTRTQTKQNKKKRRKTDWLKNAISVATDTEYNWFPGRSADKSHFPKIKVKPDSR